MHGDIQTTAKRLLHAINTASPEAKAKYYTMVGLTGACFNGGVVQVFEEQLKAVAGQLDETT